MINFVRKVAKKVSERINKTPTIHIFYGTVGIFVLATCIVGTLLAKQVVQNGEEIKLILKEVRLAELQQLANEKAFLQDVKDLVLAHEKSSNQSRQRDFKILLETAGIKENRKLLVTLYHVLSQEVDETREHNRMLDAHYKQDEKWGILLVSCMTCHHKGIHGFDGLNELWKK